MNRLDDLISSKIYFYGKVKKNCDLFFNKLTEIPNEDRFKKSKRMEINKNENGVTYDSKNEKKILKDFDKCGFIKKIKTQSLIINYTPNIKIRKYYPDIQLLLNDGSIVIVEVKPFREMVNKHNIMKHKALERYCKKNKFGIAIIDYDYYSFEDLKRERVSFFTKKKFVNFVKCKKEVTFDDCKIFKKENNITDYQICYIILNSKNLIYQQHIIKYI